MRVLIDYATDHELEKWDIYFLYLRPTRYKSHDSSRVQPLLALYPAHMLQALRSTVLVCTHSLGLMHPVSFINRSIIIVDLWHGVGFKSQEAHVRKSNSRTHLFVGSEWVKDYYINRGFDSGRLHVTGHGVWDPILLRHRDDVAPDIAPLIEDFAFRVLIAPTWNPKSVKGELSIFGASWHSALEDLSSWAQVHDTVIVFRAHMNARGPRESGLRNVILAPYARYPKTYELLSASDALVTDWSSIAVDFLPTRRPIIFLDVEPPFSLDMLEACDRAGQLVSHLDDLKLALEACISGAASRAFSSDVTRTLDKVSSGLSDGNVTRRYHSTLRALLCEYGCSAGP